MAGSTEGGFLVGYFAESERQKKELAANPPPPYWLDRQWVAAWNGVKGWMKGRKPLTSLVARGKLYQRQSDTRKLRAQLRSILVTAEGHKSNRVACGDPRYMSLWKVADRAVNDYCARWNEERAIIDAQIPGLGILRRYAHERPSEITSVAIVGTVVGLLILPFILSLVIHVIEMSYSWGTGIIQHVVR